MVSLANDMPKRSQSSKKLPSFCAFAISRDSSVRPLLGSRQICIVRSRASQIFLAGTLIQVYIFMPPNSFAKSSQKVICSLCCCIKSILVWMRIFGTSSGSFLRFSRMQSRWSLSFSQRRAIASHLLISCQSFSTSWSQSSSISVNIMNLSWPSLMLAEGREPRPYRQALIIDLRSFRFS